MPTTIRPRQDASSPSWNGCGEAGEGFDDENHVEILKVERVAKLMCQLVKTRWESNRRLRSSRVAGAGATLARIWPKLDGLPENRRLSAWLEPKIGALPSKFVPVVDAAGYISSLHGWHGSFKKNIERVIADAHWRRADSYEQLRYHHGYRNLAEHIGGHLVTRRAHPQVLCNDVGRVISIYPMLVRDGEHELASFLKEHTIKSLADADIRPTLRDKIEDLMEKRVAD